MAAESCPFQSHRGPPSGRAPFPDTDCRLGLRCAVPRACQLHAPKAHESMGYDFCGPSDINRSLISRHQPLIGIDQRIGDGGHALDMCHDTRDKLIGGGAEVVDIGFIIKCVFAIFKQRHIRMHTRSIDPKIGLGINVACKPCCCA